MLLIILPDILQNRVRVQHHFYEIVIQILSPRFLTLATQTVFLSRPREKQTHYATDFPISQARSPIFLNKIRTFVRVCI